MPKNRSDAAKKAWKTIRRNKTNQRIAALKSIKDSLPRLESFIDEMLAELGVDSRSYSQRRRLSDLTKKARAGDKKAAARLVAELAKTN